MPYIQKHLRAQALRVPLSAGELTYAITQRSLDNLDDPNAARELVQQTVDAYVARRGQVTYSTISEVVGCLMCATLEADRRKAPPVIGDVLSDVLEDFYNGVAADYEDLKCAVNGDIF